MSGWNHVRKRIRRSKPRPSCHSESKMMITIRFLTLCVKTFPPCCQRDAPSRRVSTHELLFSFVSRVMYITGKAHTSLQYNWQCRCTLRYTWPINFKYFEPHAYNCSRNPSPGLSINRVSGETDVRLRQK
jgi:hypothetical protein